ncbi:sigma-70 family RNA polymerase sigma factor [Streptomyces sp. P9-A4]|uniref:sigma-70 family RNA polymerase sigma factor n=1 Tax=Streptomyces sp. P9-A4 TaxID=3072285 RepID=UPI002FCB8945
MKRFFRTPVGLIMFPADCRNSAWRWRKPSTRWNSARGTVQAVANSPANFHLTEAEVAETKLAVNAYTVRSLDAFAGDDPQTSQGAALSRSAATEPAYQLIDDLESLGPLIARLDQRDREILALRFAQELTQAEIGRRVGLSQMHVSRLLARILSELRTGCCTMRPRARTGGKTATAERRAPAIRPRA